MTLSEARDRVIETARRWYEWQDAQTVKAHRMAIENYNVLEAAERKGG